jgi:hypothetical protein
MSYLLPLKLKVRAVRQSKEIIELECEVRDAEDQSVQSLPVSVGPKSSAANICAILQGYVDTIAKSLHAQGKAKVGEVGDQETAIEKLVGQEFLGSMAQ